jgi:hypothetical protein
MTENIVAMFIFTTFFMCNSVLIGKIMYLNQQTSYKVEKLSELDLA